VEHTGSPLLVLAGPGTGKTTTIVEAVVERLGSEALRPEQVAVLTFSRTAAAELRGRIVSRLAGGQAPVVATFHSFAWKLLRESSPEDAPRSILSEPEHLAFVREVAMAPDSTLRRLWPEERRAALDSPGLIDEIVAVMAAARAQGWEPADLVRHGSNGGPPEWVAVGRFFDEYLDVLDLPRGVDYSELVHRATVLAGAVDGLAGSYRAIYIDEYQDTDPAQVAFLRAIAVPGTTLVAVGDPDQAIYRFRGADVRGILEFPEQFPASDGSPAPVVVLDRTRRFGPQIRAVADRWIAPVGLGSLPREARRVHREPTCDGPMGIVEAVSFRTPGAQGAGVADLLRRAHLDPDVPLPWSDMAVIVRSGAADIPRLRLALLQAGVPVEVPAADEPLAADPALAPLLTGMRLAAESEAPGFEELESFLCSPLVGFDPLTLRRMMRALRSAERVRAAAENRPARASAELLAELLEADADAPAGLDDQSARLLGALHATLARARVPGINVDERLWILWDHEPDASGGAASRRVRGRSAQVEGGRWARELHSDALAGGQRGYAADATLDAVNQLFRAAASAPAGVGPGPFVDDLARQQVAAAPVDSASFNREGVRLLTAHRAKGAQWPMVVLVGLQQGRWPDARGRTSMLAAERIGPGGVQPPPSQQLAAADERRLAFVAATRAQRRLVLTAVDSDADDDCPSELFVEALDVADVVAAEGQTGGVQRTLTPASLTADLRRVLQDPRTEQDLRMAAAWRIARLAATDDGVPLCGAADPDRWWGVEPPTRADAPLAAVDRPVPLSASAIEDLGTCSLRWLLTRRAQAVAERSSAAGYGSLVHAVAAAVAEGAVDPTPEAMADALDTVFAELRFGAEWEAELAWRRARNDLGRLAAWFSSQPALPVAAEVEFDMPAGADGRLRGRIDAVIATDGGYRVVDFKTGKTPISKQKATTDVQLGVYQLALGSGTVPLPDPGPPDGASLVYLGKGALGPDQRHQAPLTDDAWLIERIDDAAALVRGEQIEATACDACHTCDVRSLCPLNSQVDWISPKDATSQLGVEGQS
ncbi:MAG: hypothetical protein RLZ55_1121, partial [Actinomycetota bacterium]